MELARRGAEHRYRELKLELASLIRQFPHLRQSIGGMLPVDEEAVKPGRGPRRRRRRRMSAEARRAVSERMKKLWAARRKAKK